MSKNKSVQYNPSLKKIIIISNNPLDSKYRKNIKESQPEKLGYELWFFIRGDFKLFNEGPHIKYQSFFRNHFDYENKYSIDYVDFVLRDFAEGHEDMNEELQIRKYKMIMVVLGFNKKKIKYVVIHGSQYIRLFLNRKVINDSKHLIFCNKEGTRKIYFKRTYNLKVLFFNKLIPNGGYTKNEIQQVLDKIKV